MAILSPGREVPTLFRDLRAVFALASEYRWAGPTLIVLGLAASLAETLGISLVVLFLYFAVGRAEELGAMAGPLGHVFRWVADNVGTGWLLGALIFSLIIARGLIGTAYGLISAHVRGRTSERVQNELHRQYLEVGYDFMRSHEQSHLLDVLASQSWTIAGVYMCLTRVVINACSIIVFAAFLLAVSWKITLLAVVGSLLLSAALRMLAAPVRQLGQQSKEAHQSFAERILVTLQGMRTIRAYGQEKTHQHSFEAASAHARDVSFKLQKLYAVISPSTEIGYFALLCAIIGLSAPLDIGFAATLSAVALLYRLQPHARELEGNLLYLVESQSPLRAVLSMLDRDDKPYLPSGHLPYTPLRDAIRFDDVSFRYGAASSPALDHASFEIPVGQTTALVGVSGSGKTTVVNLLLRLYQPDAGRIVVDGVPLSSLLQPDWLAHVAVAGQDVDLIEGTIDDNIRMADAHASTERVREVAAAAGVLSVIEDLPEGFDAWIGQQGLNLSGGQRQRIGLARALLRDPDLLILDEATSALDAGLERELRHHVRDRFAGRTVVIITHRLETVLSVGHVICLEQGRVVEAGPPALLQSHREGGFSKLLSGERSAA